jgi:hypothetical protein
LHKIAWLVIIVSASAGVTGGFGCSSSQGAVSDAAAGEPLFSCARETRAPPYMPGYMRTSTSGAVTATLLSSDPAPPAQGNNTWMIALATASTGAPLDGVAMVVTGLMPDHGHPLGVPPTVTPAGGGQYAVDDIDMFMAGYWEITLALTLPAGGADGGTSDSVMFPTCANQ